MTNSNEETDINKTCYKSYIYYTIMGNTINTTPVTLTGEEYRQMEEDIEIEQYIILNIHNIPYKLCDYIASFVYITSIELKVCCKLLDNDYYSY
jgi:hypothetical protein